MTHHPHPKHREYGRPAKELWRHKKQKRLLVTHLKDIFQAVAGDLKSPDIGIILEHPEFSKDPSIRRVRKGFEDIMEAAADVSPLDISSSARVTIVDTELVILGFDKSYEKMQAEIKKMAFMLEKIFRTKSCAIHVSANFSALKEKEIAKPTLVSYWPVIGSGGAMRRDERVLKAGDYGLFLPGTTLPIPISKANNVSLIFLATPD